MTFAFKICLLHHSVTTFLIGAHLLKKACIGPCNVATMFYILNIKLRTHDISCPLVKSSPCLSTQLIDGDRYFINFNLFISGFTQGLLGL